MAQDQPDFGLWEGLHHGVHDGPFEGAYIIDAHTGRRAQVEEVIDDDWLRVRFEDGSSERMKVRRPEPEEMRRLRATEQ